MLQRFEEGSTGNIINYEIVKNENGYVDYKKLNDFTTYKYNYN